MLNWDPKKQQPKGNGIFGRVLAFTPAHKDKVAALFTCTGKYGSKICCHKYMKTYGRIIQTFRRKPGRYFMKM